MNEAYKIAITLSVKDQASTVFKQLYNNIARLNTATDELNIKMQKIKSIFHAGVGVMATGAGIAVPIIYAIDKAAQLQKQMIAIGLATKGTTGEMDNLRHVIEKMSGITVFSSIQIAGMVKKMATGMGMSAPQLSSLVPTFVKFADAQYMMKGTSADESIGIAIRASHLAGHYDAKSMTKYLDLLNKVSLVIPGNLSEVANALQYSQSVAKNTLGVSDENMVVLVALLNRLGIKGTRGGTNLIAAMSRSIPGVFGSGLLTGKSEEAARAMGMVDKHGHANFFTHGKFDTTKWISDLARFETNEYAKYPEAIARQKIIKYFHDLMGVQGSRVGTLFATPQAAAQLALIYAQILRSQGVSGTQETFRQKSASQQYMNAKSQLVTTMTELGWVLLPDVTKGLNKLNGYLRDLIDYIQKNPTAVKTFVKSIAGLSIALVVAGGITILASAITALGVVVGVATLPITGIIAGIALIGYGLYKLWDIIKPFVKGLGGDVHQAWSSMFEHPAIHAAHSSGGSGVGDVYLDGHKVGKHVSKAQAHAATHASNGTFFFDPNMSIPHTSQNFIGGF